ncbi:uncharacterized protein [Diadema antillarum]|uniref:uncharacterized protein n=1 Tax=Diadema antillarum TaxID=105358 RepID=UPI003A892F96
MEGRWCSGSVGRVLLQLALVVALCGLVHCSLSSEIMENQEVVRFDKIYSLDDWNSTSAFVTEMTSLVNTYCSSVTNYDDCQIDAYYGNSTFTVVLSDTSPEYFNGDIRITFHVRMPVSGVKSDADPRYVLQKTVLTDILINNQVAIYNATGEKLMVVGDTRLEPIDNSLDVIMIPVACVLFLIVLLLAVALNCHQSHREKKMQQSTISADSKKGEEGITLTTVKSGNYDGPDANVSEDDNTATSSNKPNTKRFRRIKKLKPGAKGPSQDNQSQSGSQRTASPKGIEVQPAQSSNDSSNFSSNNSNDLTQSHPSSGSRHSISLPPIAGRGSQLPSLSENGKDANEKDASRRRKKHHRKLSQKALVDAAEEDGVEDGEGSTDA